MKLLKRIIFAIKYDIDREFIVYSIPQQNAMMFTEYVKADEFSKSEIQYRPKILVSVRRKR